MSKPDRSDFAAETLLAMAWGLAVSACGRERAKEIVLMLDASAETHPPPAAAVDLPRRLTALRDLMALAGLAEEQRNDPDLPELRR